MVLYVEAALYDTVFAAVQGSSIRCERLLPLMETNWYDASLTKLPTMRNHQKDTIEYLWQRHAKVYAAYQCALNNVLHSRVFVYVDFDTPRLFHKNSTWAYLRSTFGHDGVYLPEDEKRVYVPGCWSETHDTVYDSVHWRFCGTMFAGTATAMFGFYRMYETHFRAFVEACNGTLTWETNFWAWLETHTQWDPVWYAADHNDRLVTVPSAFGYKCLRKLPQCVQVECFYPALSPYRPMSAAYVHYRGQDYINTRFVNYWIYANGRYYFPEDEEVIRTINVCSQLVPVEGIPTPQTYITMKTELHAAIPFRTDTFSEGIEDMRLYVSQETGDLCFIGSTLQHSQCEFMRMVRGVYDVETLTCRNLQLIDPPYMSWCEKNWAPIPMPDGRDGFVYKWYPLEIGTVEPEGDKGRLEIVLTKPMDERFSHMKGSTAFVPYGDRGLIGVIHFSEEQTPRQYFHRVVVLDRETFDVLQCSPVFCFLKASVEFCIGFRAQEDMWQFWISQMDRDPLYLETMACWE